MPDVIRSERPAACKTHCHREAAGQVRSLEARRQGCGVVSDDEVAVSQEIHESNTRNMGDVPACIYDQKFRLLRTLNGQMCGNHGNPPIFAVSGGQSLSERRLGRAKAMAWATSLAATSGCFNVAGSQSGTARACSGVSMSPGSKERKRMPKGSSSAFQTALK